MLPTALMVVSQESWDVIRWSGLMELGIRYPRWFKLPFRLAMF